MAFSFTTVNEFVAKTPLENKMEILDLTTQAQEAYAELVRAEVDLSGTESIMDNICEAMTILSKKDISEASVEMLDIYALFPEGTEDICKEEALEGLGDALKKAWNKLVEWITGIFKALWNFLKALVGLGPKTAKKCDDIVTATKEDTAEVNETLKEKETAAPVMTPEQSKVNTEVQKKAVADADELIKLQDTLEKKIQELSNQKEPAKNEDLEALFELTAGLEKRIADSEATVANLEEALKKAEGKATLADKKWTDASKVAAEAASIKEAATKTSQTFVKKMDEVSKRRERIMKLLTGAAITFVCPAAGLAYGAYQYGKAKKEQAAQQSEGSTPEPSKPEEKQPKATPEFANKLKSLVASMGKKAAGLGKIFSKTRKRQEQQIQTFVTVLEPVTKEEIEQADAHNTNEALKKKQEEMGLETESFNIDLESVEGFMDLVKSVANKVKSGFASTLKKITDITERGVSAAEKSDWDHVLGLGNPSCSENDKLLNYRQANALLNTTIPAIIDDAKKIIPVYNKSKTVDELPKPEEMKKITGQITDNTDYSVNFGMAYGPNGSGNVECDWRSGHSKSFASQYVRRVKEGMPQEVIKMTSTEQSADTSVEATRSVAAARWFIKAYGKCLAEISKTIVKLSATCGQTEEAKAFGQQSAYSMGMPA